MWACKCLLCFGFHSFSICPGVVSLDHMVGLISAFWGTFILFSIVIALSYIPTNSWQVFILSLHPCQHLLLFVLLMIVILTVMVVSVILIYISLIAKDVEHFFLYLSTIYTSFLFYFFNFKIFLYFVVLGYIVTFTKIFTIYFSQIVPSIIVLYAPTS
jgi:hypothetical protein